MAPRSSSKSTSPFAVRFLSFVRDYPGNFSVHAAAPRFSLPRTRRITAAITQRTIETRNALRIPTTNACIALRAQRDVRSDKQLHHRIPGKAAGGDRQAKSEARTMPVCRSVARVADAMPRRCSRRPVHRGARVGGEEQLRRRARPERDPRRWRHSWCRASGVTPNHTSPAPGGGGRPWREPGPDPVGQHPARVAVDGADDGKRYEQKRRRERAVARGPPGNRTR